MNLGPAPVTSSGYTVESAVADLWPTLRIAAITDSVRTSVVDAVPWLAKGIVNKYWSNIVDKFGPRLLKLAIELAVLGLAPWLLPFIDKLWNFLESTVKDEFMIKLEKARSLLKTSPAMMSSEITDAAAQMQFVGVEIDRTQIMKSQSWPTTP